MSLAAQLRSATRDDHDRIELAFALERRLASAGHYRDLLVRLHGFHSAFEAAAAPAFAGTPLVRYLDRGALIAKDIRALDASAPPGIPRDGREGPAISLPRRADALGALYVVEGSILGGVLIAREVGRRLGFGPETGAGFFSGHGRDTARTWGEFCRLLDAEDRPGVGDAAAAAARGTYRILQGWLCEDALGPEPEAGPIAEPVPA